MHAINSFQDLSNDSAPSSWSWAARASMSMPAPGELGQHLLAVAAVGGQRSADLAVVGEGLQRGLGHRVHRERGGERLDVQDVGGFGVLGPGAGPQEALRAGAGVESRCQRGESSRSRYASYVRWAMAMPSWSRSGLGHLAHAPPTSQRLMNSEATEPTSGFSPAAMRRSMPRRYASAAATYCSRENRSVTLIGTPAKIASSMAGTPSGCPGS